MPAVASSSWSVFAWPSSSLISSASCCPSLFCQSSQFVLAVTLLASVAAWRPDLKSRATIAFHALFGALLLFAPGAIYGKTVIGAFDALHTLQQQFLAPFHIGFAVIHWLNAQSYGVRTPFVEPIFHATKAISSSLLLLVQLYTAYTLFNDSQARGIRASKNFFGCALLIDGVWQFVEKYHVVHYVRSILAGKRKGQVAVAADEIDLMVKRTQRLVEDSTLCMHTEMAYWVSAGWPLLFAVAHFAYPEQLLALFIRREFVIDAVHVFYSRLFACQWIGLSLLGLSASTRVGIENQRNFALQLVATFVSLTAVQAWGHFGLGVYNSTHIIPFVFSLFLIGIQLVLYKCVCNERTLEKKVTRISSSMEKAPEEEDREEHTFSGKKTYHLRKTVAAD